MKTIKLLSYILGLPLLIFSILFLLISMIGFSWSRGELNYGTLISLLLIIISVFMFRVISKTNKLINQIIALVLLFISLFLSISIILSTSA